MTPSLSTSNTFILPLSLQDLHQRTLEWESSLELWKRELSFFRKLIDQYGRQLHLREEINEREHFRFLLSFYSGELMNSLSNKIRLHETNLKPLIRGKNTQDEQAYRDEHQQLEKQMKAIEREFHCYKGELFSLVEKVIAKQKEHTKTVTP
jgi:hypothetical protein